MAGKYSKGFGGERSKGVKGDESCKEAERVENEDVAGVGVDGLYSGVELLGWIP